MATAAQIVATAASQIGVTEKPRGTNRTPYGAWYGMNGQPWCSIFVAWCYAQHDIDLRRVVTPGYASCEMALVAYRAKRWTLAPSAAQPGDIVFFQFDRDRAADHTGIVESVTGGRLVTVEGNTGATNQTNGGAVMRRTRSWAQVKGVARVPLLTATAPPAAPIPAPAPHPNPDAAPAFTPPQESEMRSYLIKSSDGRIWNTDGLVRRPVATPENVKKLVFLGQVSNAHDSAGNVQIPTDDAFLSDIPVGS